VNPKLVVGGNPSLGTLQLNAPAPASSSGIMSSFTVLANTIPNFSTPIPQGATTANVDVLTARVSSPQFVPIDGSYYTPRSDGSVGGRIGLTWLILVPGSPPPFQLTSFNFDSSGLTSVVGGTRVNSFFLDPFDVPGGTSATGLVILNGSAPAGGATVTLVSANTDVVTMPPSVTVPAGSDRVSFAIATRPVSSNTTVTLTANFNGTWTATSLIVTPTPGTASLASLAVSPSSVVGGNGSTGTVTLSGPAPAGGAAVGLASNRSTATVPGSVTVPAAHRAPPSASRRVR
jgi:hypothetical protein